MLDPRTVANTYVRTLLSAVEALGVPPQRLLHGLPLTEAELAAPNGRIGVAVVRSIWERALALTGEPLLGLRVAESMQPSTFRVLGLAAMSCASLAEGLALMLRYQRLVSEAGTLTAHAQANGDVTVVYTEQPMRLRLLPQQVEAISAGILCQARWLAGRPIVPQAVSFRHAAPGRTEDYQQFFGVAVEFNAAENRVRLAAADLQIPLPQADADLCRLHCELADRQLASLPQVGFVTGFAMQWLSTRTSGAAHISDLAEALGMSVRSLQRQLKLEGKSWTDVIDAARREALSALLQQGLSLEDAAQRLGYHDASSLSRAARRWFGKTPGQWRSDVESP